MKQWKGTGLSAGVQKGVLLFLRRGEYSAAEKALSPEQEFDRFQKACEQSLQQLEQEANLERQRETAAGVLLLRAHEALIRDEVWQAAVAEKIEQQGLSASEAVRATGDAFAAALDSLSFDPLDSRSADLRDVTQRVLQNMNPETPSFSGLLPPPADPKRPVKYLVAADELSPSVFLRMDRERLAGIVTKAGSPNSHTSILARSFGIPYVCGPESLPDRNCEGKTLWIHGTEGTLYLDPDAELEKRLEEERLSASSPLKEKPAPSRKPALPFKLLCNISSPAEAELAAAAGADGIGLLRSEFLFPPSPTPPSEEEQLEAYQTVLATLGEKRVVIRTLDIGSDKQVPYLHLPAEKNPALGLRGIRLCLRRPDIFLTQLRAIYRASVCGNTAILIPMVTDVSEVRAVRSLCETVKEQLQSENIPFRDPLPLGVMIETPAAVFLAAELAREADFFSLGTNDLTQYTLAFDRESASDENAPAFSGDAPDAHIHPAVEAAIRQAAKAAREAGIPIALCGELAADATLLPLFQELGIEELSVSISSLETLRNSVPLSGDGQAR